MNDRSRWDDSTQWEVPGQVHRDYARKRRSDRWKTEEEAAPAPRSKRRRTHRVQLHPLHPEDLKKLLQPRNLAMLVCAAVMIIALWQLIGWGLGVINTWQTNRELRAMRAEADYAASVMTQAPFMTPYALATPTPAAPTATAYAAAPNRTPVTLVTATPVPESKKFHLDAGEVLPELKTLYEKNHDLAGWLTIPGVVDLPVVHRDNSYYLYRDFYGKNSKSGTLFLDENHPVKSTTQHLVIHGHNMNDGSMFGLLGHYKDKNYIRNHGVITFSTLYEKETYAIFAVAMTPEDTRSADFIPFIGNPTFRTESAFNYYIDKVKKGALYQLYLDVKPTDALLTLSTCMDDNRILLVCRKLRPGETEADVRRQQLYSID